MKILIRYIFAVFGFELRRKQLHRQPCCYNDQMVLGFKRVSQLHLPIKTIVDVGAAQGLWSLSAKSFWPASSFVLFEPLQERAEELRRVIEGNENFFHVPRAAGKEAGTASFAIASDLDGSGVVSEDTNSEVRSVQVTSIQDELRKLKLKGPYLIKLDTHGFEVPIIEGCTEILDEVSLFIIECYGFQITKGSLLFWQMCEHMDSIGFRLFDIVDVMHRSKDGAFWQCDAFFIRKDTALFKDNSYA